MASVLTVVNKLVERRVPWRITPRPSTSSKIQKYSHNFELILAANREGANKHDTYRVSSGATITRQIYS